jgi:hypothetical protein
MSTKIYQAWRFPESRLYDFLDWYCSIVAPKVQKHVDTLIKQRICTHPDDQMTITYIGPEAEDMHGRHVAIGRCALCDIHIKGTALPVPGVKPHEPKGDLLFYSDFNKMEELSKTTVLGTDAQWTRPKPLSEKEEDPKMLRYLAATEIGDICKKAAASKVRVTDYDIECGVKLTLYKHKWYAVPVGEYWTWPEDGAKPEFAEDYSYWDNVDPPSWALPPEDSPDDIYDHKSKWTPGMKKWEKRGEDWDAVFWPKGSEPTKWLDFWVVQMLRDSFIGTERIHWLDLD